MNIGSGSGYPSSSLSNFAGHRFLIDDILCNSMEGFLQSLKFKSPEMQEQVCKMIGLGAKFKGKNKKWWQTQTLWWKGVEIDRHSIEYQILLNRAYNRMYKQSESFRKALAASQNSVLTHSIGKNEARKTVLTTNEFCRRLMHLRDVGLLNEFTGKY